MKNDVTIVHYWGGCPQTPNSKWQRFFHVIERCIQRGWNTYMVFSAIPDDDSLIAPFRRMGCRLVVRPRARKNFDPVCMVSTFRLLRELSCDVFHCHNVHTSPLIGASLAAVPARLWSKLSMTEQYERGVEPRGIHRLCPSLRVSSFLAHRILALSKAVGDEIIDLGTPADRVFTVPGPIDYEKYENAEPADLRRELGLAPDDMIITSVGHAIPLKGWDLLIDALARIKPDVPNAKVLLVGSISDPEESRFAGELRKRADQLRLNDSVFFLGVRCDIPNILKASDIFAFPTRSDGQGLALTEALASGLPCVGCNVGGVPELICHEHNGLLFPRDDSDTLSRQLARLCADEQLRATFADRARTTVKRFDMTVYVNTVHTHYDALLDAG